MHTYIGATRPVVRLTVAWAERRSASDMALSGACGRNRATRSTPRFDSRRPAAPSDTRQSQRGGHRKAIGKYRGRTVRADERRNSPSRALATRWINPRTGFRFIDRDLLCRDCCRCSIRAVRIDLTTPKSAIRSRVVTCQQNSVHCSVIQRKKMAAALLPRPCNVWHLRLGARRERHEGQVLWANIIGGWADDLVVHTLFDHVRAPAGGAGDHEKRRKHRRRHTHHVI